MPIEKHPLAGGANIDDGFAEMRADREPTPPIVVTTTTELTMTIPEFREVMNEALARRYAKTVATYGAAALPDAAKVIAKARGIVLEGNSIGRFALGQYGETITVTIEFEERQAKRYTRLTRLEVPPTKAKAKKKPPARVTVADLRKRQAAARAGRVEVVKPKRGKRSTTAAGRVAETKANATKRAKAKKPAKAPGRPRLAGPRAIKT